ncbi:MAG TPA: zf-HC2 domain-containing protein, partial [Thermoanaerobaculia bacterium]|nr:zf-HC2 domain-containing protein [Thermoanaerobaculia bacterium]
LAAVLAQTSGPACEAAAARLAGALDAPLEPADRALLDLHVAGCAACRQLGVTLRSLARDLPRLAEPVADPLLVARVLAATLPFNVRWRRWWAASWPAWVQRPRFAVETAFVVTTIFLLLFQAVGSPLQALPRRALQATQQARFDGIEARAAELREHAVSRLRADRLLPHTRTTFDAGRRLAGRLLRSGKAELGTIWQRAASSWQEGNRPSTMRRDGRAAPKRK